MSCHVTLLQCFFACEHGKWCAMGVVFSKGMHLYGCVRYTEAP
jgi:hypothetical protein